MATLREARLDGLEAGQVASESNTAFDQLVGTGLLGVTPGIKGASALRYQGTALSFLSWVFAARTSVYVRGYIRVDNAGTANQTFVSLNLATDPSTARVAEVRFRSTNRDFQIRNNTATAVATSSAFALGDVIRWEWFVDRTAQTQTLRLFNTTNADGTTPSQTITGSTGAGSSTFTRLNIGSLLTQGGTPSVVLDEIIMADDWPGPYVAPSGGGPTAPYEFVEWNGTTATVLTAHEWNGTTLTALETVEQT